MKATLIIKDFGPVKDCQLEINKYTLLIGPQASGKSTVSKVLAVIHSFDYSLISVAGKNRPMEQLKQFLVYYRIENYLCPTTYWFFEDEIFSFEFTGQNITITHKDTVEKTASRTECYYFPAERIALPMISESLFELTLAQSTLPQYFLQFGKDFTIARRNQNKFNLPLLGLEYEHTDGQNRITLHNNRSLLLEEASSAIQANVPLMIILQYPIKESSLFVIEELELHGFPILQKKLLYYVIERMRHPRLDHAYVILPTHSPYILSAANNLLLASKTARQNKSALDQISMIIPQKSWIEGGEFSAYYLADGRANSIIDQQTGLIHENALDTVSEDLASESDALMELYKPATA